MYKHKKILGILTARGGSKRIPGKNLLDLGGKNLITWTIEAATNSVYIDKLILSTDDKSIADQAIKDGCEVPFLRPDELSGDYASSVDVVLHALSSLGEGYDFLTLLQPTSPFRSVEDINSCIEKTIDEDVNSVISVTESEKSPHLDFYLNEEDKLESVVGIDIESLKDSRSQDLPISYGINGAVYVCSVSWFLKNKTFFDRHTKAYKMPWERSVNIDTYQDLMIANAILSSNFIKKDERNIL